MRDADARTGERFPDAEKRRKTQRKGAEGLASCGRRPLEIQRCMRGLESAPRIPAKPMNQYTPQSTHQRDRAACRVARTNDDKEFNACTRGSRACPDMRTPAASEATAKAGIRACETPAARIHRAHRLRPSPSHVRHECMTPRSDREPISMDPHEDFKFRLPLRGQRRNC